jgi:hypothetical protein
MGDYTLEKLPGEPIVVFQATKSYDLEADTPVALDELTRIVDSSDIDLIYIADVRNITFDLADLAYSANLTTRGEGAIFHHPKLREIIAVTTSKLVELTFRGMDSDVYGGVKVAVFPTLEEALEYARSKT